MKKFLAVFLFFSLILAGISYASELSDLVNKFYSDLADIIEANMEAPEKCVEAVDSYYAVNQATVAKIRDLSEEPVAQAAKMMKSYEAMSDQELEALAEKSRQENMRQRREQMSPGATKYMKAITAFTQKYPMQALRISTRAMQLMPR